MQELPETRESLLMQIQEPENRTAWEEFVEIYRPVVYRIGVARGLQHADALDLVQTVFISIAGSIANWESRDDRTRFRHWLLRVAKNATINAVTRKSPDRAVGGDSMATALVNRAAQDNENDSQIDLEYKRQLYRRAAEQVRVSVSEVTWQAFEMTAVKGMAIDEAARETGMSRGAIYAARSRIMKRLTEIVARLEESYR